MRKKSFAKRNGKILEATDINLVTDEEQLGMERFNFSYKYLGPNGSVKKISNGMNCSNCHLDAGTKPWGNNYGSVFSISKMRGRTN
jgi:thiosulfate dehydrogenase